MSWGNIGTPETWSFCFYLGICCGQNHSRCTQHQMWIIEGFAVGIIRIAVWVEHLSILGRHQTSPRNCRFQEFAVARITIVTQLWKITILKFGKSTVNRQFSIANCYFTRGSNIWVNYNDLTTTSPQMMISKGNHPQMGLIQVSELL